jgi:polysaccharide biosynthesis/export protein
LGLSLYNGWVGVVELKVLARLRGRRYLVPLVIVALFFHSRSFVFAQDVSVSGTPQEANDKIKSMGQASAKSSSHEYTIGSGDLLDISVFDVPELTREVRVSQSGAISIPLVPARLHVAGLTEIQAQQKIADVLEANGLVSHPEVSVSVKEHRSRPITIVGAVGHPMVYEADRGVTLLEVLAEAGGVANDAGDTVIISRPRSAVFVPIANPETIPEPAPGAAASVAPAGSPTPPDNPNNKEAPPNDNAATAFPSAAQAPQSPSEPQDSNAATTAPSGSTNIITINLNQLLESGDMQNNIPLLAGDVVTVPHAGIVYVLGAVNRPGGFVLSNDRSEMTTLKILSLAGGQTRAAKLDHAIIIRKDGQGKQTETDVNLKKIIDRQSEDLQVRASDILYVPDSKAKEALYQTLQLTAAIVTSVAIYRIAYH